MWWEGMSWWLVGRLSKDGFGRHGKRPNYSVPTVSWPGLVNALCGGGHALALNICCRIHTEWGWAAEQEQANMPLPTTHNSTAGAGTINTVVSWLST